MPISLLFAPEPDDCCSLALPQTSYKGTAPVPPNTKSTSRPNHLLPYLALPKITPSLIQHIDTAVPDPIMKRISQLLAPAVRRFSASPLSSEHGQPFDALAPPP